MPKRRRSPTLAWGVAVLLWSLQPWEALAQSGSIQRGRTFARANCSKCHSIDAVTPSPLPIAPAFRTLSRRYPIEDLRESLAEGIVTAHQNMPEFRLEPDQIDDFLAFLKSLQPRQR